MTTGNELNALFSAYADGERLDPSERSTVERALSSSESARRDLALQEATRRLVRQRSNSLRADVPNDLLFRITRGMDEADRAPERQPQTRQAWSLTAALQGIFASPRYVRGLIVTGSVVAVALVALFLLRTSPTSSAELSSLAYTSFGTVVNGSFAIERESSNESELRSFFASQGVDFPIFFPQLDATLRGGSVVTINGQQCAQLVYAAGPKTVYLLEADNNDVVDGSVQLDQEIRQDVEQSRWHWEERDEIGTLFVWKSNNVMCTAVSDMPTQEFSALFRLETL